MMKNYKSVFPVLAGMVSYAGYCYYIQQTNPEEPVDQMTGVKIAAGVAVAVFVTQNMDSMSGTKTDVLTEPFHDNVT